MLRLSKKLLFAIEAVVDIAYHAGATPVRSSDISERQGIPRRYLEQVLQHLVRAGVLAGQRGPKGGYRLARERRRITLGEIVRVVRQLEMDEAPPEQSLGSEIGKRVVAPLWRGIEDDIMARFDNMTVEELCDQARVKGIARETAAAPDFSI